MRRFTIVVAVLALAAVPAFAQSKASVVSTVHDTTKHGETVANVCTGCHTPHINNTTDIGVLFWAREAASTATFQVYAAPLTTTEASITKPTTGATSSAWYSYLCLTCHDDGGSTATAGFLNTTNLKFPHDLSGGGGIDRTHFAGTTLQTDHPVNFVYDSAVHTVALGYNAPAASAHAGGANKVGALPLFDGGGRDSTVQCATCHNPHAANYTYAGEATGSGTPGGQTRTFFLRTAAGPSGVLCLECHN